MLSMKKVLPYALLSPGKSHFILHSGIRGDLNFRCFAVFVIRFSIKTLRKYQVYIGKLFKFPLTRRTHECQAKILRQNCV